MLKNSRKKLYLLFSFFILLLAALGMVIATGWDASKASHDTLYADTVRAKEDVTHTITFEDNLAVNAYCEFGSCDTAITAVSGGAGVAIDASHFIGNEAQLATSSAGVYGYSASFYGVSGSSTSGVGIRGYSQTNNGVSGESDSDDGVYGTSMDGAGVNGYSANSIGISGNCGSLGCYGLYTNNIVYAGKGITVPSGQTCSDGSTGGCSLNDMNDIAEDIPAADDVEAGDVVIIDVNNPEKVVKSVRAYDSLVAGIISTSPALHIDSEESNTPLALAGRVPAKASAENGPIEIGDLLTTSNTPGHLMRCNNRFECSGVLVGKALEPLESGQGKIIVLVTLG